MRYEKQTGGKVLAIPHNGNLSNGLMYTAETYDHNPIDRAYADARINHEPLMEVTQIKGDGETHPYLSPTDEFANFELWDMGNLADPTTPKEKGMLQYEYARSALKRGLELEGKLGVNPYKFGMVGASDGHMGVVYLAAGQLLRSVYLRRAVADALEHCGLQVQGRHSVRSLGLAGIYLRAWAAYGLARTPARRSGTRSSARKSMPPPATGRSSACSPGWDFEPADADRPNFAAQGYARGVPMGGDLSKAPTGKSPSFVVSALRDPDGPNLDRIQIIKGWLDNRDGKTNERIYDVAVSGGRMIGPDGRCPTPVGSTVDVANATYTNTIGAPMLSAYWKDPAFDPAQQRSTTCV